jgi:hypothetical protein
MSRIHKKTKRAGQGGAVPSLSCIEPHAAGSDVGATEIFVAAPQDRDPSPVRSFEIFTEDLHRLKSWLQQCGITTVAMDPLGCVGFRCFHARVQASQEVITKSLVGDYQREHLFTFRQSLQAYRYYQSLITTCDQEIAEQLQNLDSRTPPDASPLPPERYPHRPRKNEFRLTCAANCIGSTARI